MVELQPSTTSTTTNNTDFVLVSCKPNEKENEEKNKLSLHLCLFLLATFFLLTLLYLAIINQTIYIFPLITATICKQTKSVEEQASNERHNNNHYHHNNHILFINHSRKQSLQLFVQDSKEILQTDSNNNNNDKFKYKKQDDSGARSQANQLTRSSGKANPNNDNILKYNATKSYKRTSLKKPISFHQNKIIAAKNGSQSLMMNDDINNSNQIDLIDCSKVTPLVAPILVKYILIALHGLIFVFGFGGNMLTIFVMLRKLRRLTIMDIFIANLALSDILLCIFGVTLAPISTLTYGYWIFDLTTCRIFSYGVSASVYISTFTMVCIAYYRYELIVNQGNLLTSRVAYFLCSLTWLIGILITTPYLYHVKIVPPNCPIAFCQEEWDERSFGRSKFTLISMLFQFAIPFILSSHFYWSIFRKLTENEKIRISMDQQNCFKSSNANNNGTICRNYSIPLQNRANVQIEHRQQHNQQQQQQQHADGSMSKIWCKKRRKSLILLPSRTKPATVFSLIKNNRYSWRQKRINLLANKANKNSHNNANNTNRNLASQDKLRRDKCHSSLPIKLNSQTCFLANSNDNSRKLIAISMLEEYRRRKLIQQQRLRQKLPPSHSKKYGDFFERELNSTPINLHGYNCKNDNIDNNYNNEDVNFCDQKSLNEPIKSSHSTHSSVRIYIPKNDDLNGDKSIMDLGDHYNNLDADDVDDDYVRNKYLDCCGRSNSVTGGTKSDDSRWTLNENLLLLNNNNNNNRNASQMDYNEKRKLINDEYDAICQSLKRARSDFGTTCRDIILCESQRQEFANQALKFPQSLRELRNDHATRLYNIETNNKLQIATTKTTSTLTNSNANMLANANARRRLYSAQNINNHNRTIPFSKASNICHRQLLLCDPKLDRHRNRLTRSTNLKLFAILGLFVISWLPLNSFNIYIDFTDSDEDTTGFPIAYMICQMCACFSVCLNPILYAWMSENYRQDLITTGILSPFFAAKESTTHSITAQRRWSRSR